MWVVSKRKKKDMLRLGNLTQNNLVVVKEIEPDLETRLCVRRVEGGHIPHERYKEKWIKKKEDPA